MDISELAEQVLRKIRANQPEGQLELERLWQDKEIVREFDEHGYVLLWGSVVNDFLAYYDDAIEGILDKIPAHYVPYSNTELRIISQGDMSEKSLKHIHMAKKLTSVKDTSIEVDADEV